jgi:hypothetical protein
MPTLADPVYEHMATSLAQMRQPDFAGFADSDVDAAMFRAWEGLQPKPAWLAALQDRIRELSFGFVELQESSPAAVPNAIKSLAVSYFLLVGTFQRQLLYMLPGTRPPVQFV